MVQKNPDRDMHAQKSHYDNSFSITISRLDKNAEKNVCLKKTDIITASSDEDVISRLK